jgi:hypothetical protein
MARAGLLTVYVWQFTCCESDGAALPPEVPCSMAGDKIVVVQNSTSDIFARLYDDRHREVGAEFLPSPREDRTLLYSRLYEVTPAHSALCMVAPKGSTDTLGISACDDASMMAVEEGLDVRVREVAYVRDFLFLDAKVAYVGIFTLRQSLPAISVAGVSIDGGAPSWYPILPGQDDVLMVVGPLAHGKHRVALGSGQAAFTPWPRPTAGADDPSRHVFVSPTSYICVN